jgi:predicted amidohydrolase YtcJ
MSKTIFYNGKVLTQDTQLPYATAFIVEQEKISDVGDDDTILSLQLPDDILVDLENNFVIPGFNDAHIHIWKVGNMITHMLDLRGVPSIKKMLTLIQEYADNNSQLSWIQGRGFNEADLLEKRMPTKADLDTLNISKPICLTRTCAHQIVVNEFAMRAAGIQNDTKVPAGGEMKLDADGNPNGHFTETAIGLILSKIPKYTAAELRAMILAAQEQFISYGITAATDPAVDRDLLEVYKQMDAAGELKIRINAVPIRVPDGANKVYPNPEHYYSDHLVVNTVKFFADGGISGKTAALTQPYLNTNEQGVLRLEKNTFHELALESQTAGFQIATHAIGDAAVKMVIDVYSEIAATNHQQLRHRIEHLGLPDADDLERMYQHQITAVMQPIFIKELGNNFILYVPEHFLNRLYPLRSVLDYGIVLALSTDAPVVKNYHPLTNISAAVKRKTNSGKTLAEPQQINLDEAIYAYTMGSAIAGNCADTLGSISKHKFADFIVLDGFDDANNRIKQTYIGGKPCL